MNNKFNQKALLISIVIFTFMSTASANGKWIISGDSLLNLNNYSTIQKQRLACATNYKDTSVKGMFIQFSGKVDFFLKIYKCVVTSKNEEGKYVLIWDEDASDRLNDTFEEIIDFLKDDDEYLVLD